MAVAQGTKPKQRNLYDAGSSLVQRRHGANAVLRPSWGSRVVEGEGSDSTVPISEAAVTRGGAEPGRASAELGGIRGVPLFQQL